MNLTRQDSIMVRQAPARLNIHNNFIIEPQSRNFGFNSEVSSNQVRDTNNSRMQEDITKKINDAFKGFYDP